jgi:hypothetical protein
LSEVGVRSQNGVQATFQAGMLEVLCAPRSD